MAIPHDPDTIGQCRLDAGLHQLYPGGIHQQQFGLDGKAFVMHLFDDGPHPLGQRRTARLAGTFDPLDAVVLQIVCDVTDGRALPCPFQTFNNDKFRHQDFFNMYSRTARLCSSRVLEK